MPARRAVNLAASVLLCSLLLPTWATAVLAAANLAGLLLLPPLIPAISAQAFTSLFIFVGFFSLLIVVSAAISQRDQADLDRQTLLHQESEQRFRLLFSASPDSILDILLEILVR